MENPIKNNLEFYSKFTKPLIFNLPEAKDRVLAAGWVKKIRSPEAGTEKLRTDYIKLLLFALQRQKLVGIFADDPESYETLEPFPEEYDLNEMAKLLIEKEQFERVDRIKRQLKGQGEDYPPYTTDCSSDFREYVAAQDIPNFGVHCYYAISKEPVNTWAKVEKGIFPKMAKSAVDTSGPSSPGTASDSCVCAPKEDPEVEPSECKKRVPSITESPKKRRSPKKLGKSPPTQPIGKTAVPDEREPPLWGSNLLEVRDATPQDDDDDKGKRVKDTKSKQQPIDEDDDFDLKEMTQAMKDFNKGVLSPQRGKGQSRRPMHKSGRQGEAEQSQAPLSQDESADIGEQDLEISMYDEDIQEDKRLIDYFREKLVQSNIKQNIAEVSEHVKESSPATAGIPLTTPIPSASPKRQKNSDKLYKSEKERCQPKRKISPDKDADLMKLFQDAIGAADSLENTSMPSGIPSSPGSSPGQQYDQLFSAMDQANIQETSMPSGMGSMISSGQGSPSRQQDQLFSGLDKSNTQDTSIPSAMASLGSSKQESPQKQQKPQSPVKPIERGSPESAPIFADFVQIIEENAAKEQENQPAPTTPPIFSKDPATRAAAQGNVYVDGMEHDGPWMHGPEFFEGMEEFEPYDPRLREVPEEMFPGLQRCIGDQMFFDIEGEPNIFDEMEQFEQFDISGRELQQIADQSMDMLADEDPCIYEVYNESLPVSPMTIFDTSPPSGLSMAMSMSPTPPQRQAGSPQMSPQRTPTPQAKPLPQRVPSPQQAPSPQRAPSPQQRVSPPPPSPRAATPCGSSGQQTSPFSRKFSNDAWFFDQQTPVFDTTPQSPYGADFGQNSGEAFNYLTADQIGRPIDLFSEVPPENYFEVDEVAAPFDSFGNGRPPSPAGVVGPCGAGRSPSPRVDLFSESPPVNFFDDNVGGYKSDDCMGILDVSGLDSIGTSMYSLDELPDLSYQELQKFPPPPAAAGSCRKPREFEHVGYAGDYRKPARLDLGGPVDESLRKAEPKIAPKQEKPQLSAMEEKYIDWLFARDKDTRDMVKRVASMVADVEQDFPDPYHIMPQSPQFPSAEGYGIQDESFPDNLVSPRASPQGAAALPPGVVPPRGATPPPPGPPSPVMRPLSPMMRPTQPQAGPCGSGIKPPTSGLRQPESRLRPPGSGLRPPSGGIQPPGSRLPSPGAGTCGSGIRPPGSGIRPPVSGIRPPGSRTKPTGSGIPSSGSGIKPPGSFSAVSGIRPPGSSIPVPGIGTRPSGSGIRPPGSGIPVPGTGIRPCGSGIRPPSSGIRPPGSGIRPPGSGIRPPGSGMPPSGSNIQPPGGNMQLPRPRPCGATPITSRTDVALEKQNRLTGTTQRQRQLLEESMAQGANLANQFNIQTRPAQPPQGPPKPSSPVQQSRSPLAGFSMMDGSGFMDESPPAGFFDAQSPGGTPCGVCGGAERVSPSHQLPPSSPRDGLMAESPPPGFFDIHSPGGEQGPCGVCPGSSGIMGESPPAGFFDEPYHVDVRPTDKSHVMKRPIDMQKQILDATSQAEQISRQMENQFIKQTPGMLSAAQQRDLAEPRYIGTPQAGGPCQADQRKRGVSRRGPETRRRRLADEYGLGPELQDRQDEYISGVLSRHPDLPQLPPQTPQGSPCLIDQRVPQNLPTPLRPPVVVPGWQTPEHLKRPELKPRQFENIVQNDMNNYFFDLSPDVELLPSSPRTPLSCGARQQQGPVSSQARSPSPPQSRPSGPPISQPQQPQSRSRSPCRTRGGPSPRSMSPPQRTPPGGSPGSPVMTPMSGKSGPLLTPPSGTAHRTPQVTAKGIFEQAGIFESPPRTPMGPAPRPSSPQAPRTPNVFDMVGQGSGLMEQSPPRFQDVQSPDGKDSCACIGEATQLPSPPPLQISPGAARIMDESPPPGFGPLPVTADDMLKEFTIVRDGQIVQKPSRPEGPQRRPPIRQPSPPPAQATPIVQASPAQPSPHQAYAGTPQRGTPCQAGSKRRGVSRRGPDVRKRRLEDEYGVGHEMQQRNEQYMAEVLERHPDLPPASPCNAQQRPALPPRQLTTWETPEHLRPHQQMEALTKGQQDAMFFNQSPDIQLPPSPPPLTPGVGYQPPSPLPPSPQMAQRSPCQQMTQRSPSPQQRTPPLPSQAGPSQWENPDQWFFEGTPEMDFPSSPPASPCGGYQQQPIPMPAPPSPQQGTPRQPCSAGRSLSPITTPQLNLSGPLETPPSGTAYRTPKYTAKEIFEQAGIFESPSRTPQGPCNRPPIPSPQPTPPSPGQLELMEMRRNVQAAEGPCGIQRRPMRWTTKKHEPMMGPIKESSPGPDQFGLPRVQEFPLPTFDPTVSSIVNKKRPPPLLCTDVKLDYDKSTPPRDPNAPKLPPPPTGIPGWSTPPHLKNMRGIPDAHFFDNEYQPDLVFSTPGSPVTPHVSPNQCGICSESPPEGLYSPASVGEREQSFYTPQMDVPSGQITPQWEELANRRFDDISFGNIDLVSSAEPSPQRTPAGYLDQSSRGPGTLRSLSPDGQMFDSIDQPSLSSPCGPRSPVQGSPTTGSPLSRRTPPGRPTQSPSPSSDASYYSEQIKAQLSPPTRAQRSPTRCSPSGQANVQQQQQQRQQQQQQQQEQQHRQQQQQEQQQQPAEKTVSRTYVQRRIVTGLPTPPKELYGSGLSSGEGGMLDVSDDTIPPELANFKWMDQ